MSIFVAERKVFKDLKSKCINYAKQEYEEAIAYLHRHYNPTVYEHRFIVGGVIEAFTCALLRSTGTCCRLESQEGIVLPNDRRLSVSSTFQGGPTSITVLNKMGEGHRSWDTATLFVVSKVGIVYGDSEIVDCKEIEDVGDRVRLSKKGVEQLIENDSLVFRMNLKPKPPFKETCNPRASYTLAKHILKEQESSKLLKYYP